MFFALLALILAAVLGAAQDNGLSQFTVADWSDISYGQPKLLTWTPGNGRVRNTLLHLLLPALSLCLIS